MLFDSTSDGLAALAARTGMDNRTMMIQQHLSAAERWKPRGYNTEVAKRRDYLAGEQTKHLRGHLAERFENTHERMWPFCVPLFQHLVEQTATIYRAAPRREIKDNKDATSLANQAYSAAMVDARMRRVEQIAAAARLAFARVGWDEYDERLDIVPYWPDQVHVDFHPDYPTRLDRAFSVIAELTSEAGVDPSDGDRRYELWVRQSAGTDSAWERSVVTANGRVWSPPEGEERIHRRLPWIAVPFETPDGCLFEMPATDGITTQDAVNSLYTDLLYTIEMQAFSQLTFTGPEDPGAIVAGPGTCLVGGEGGRFDALAYNPSISAVKETASDIIRRLLVLNSVSPSTASVDPSYQSGQALRVENQPMMESRLARVPIYRDIEQRQLWPVCRDVYNSNGPGGLPIDGEMLWEPGEIMLPLDDMQEMELSERRVEANISTWPKEMVRQRISSNLDDAEEQYKANEEKNGPKQPPPPAFGQFPPQNPEMTDEMDENGDPPAE